MLSTTQGQVDKILDVTKKTGAYVSRLRTNLHTTKKQEIRAIEDVTDQLDKFSKEIDTSDDSLCTKVINTLKYIRGRN